MSIEAQLRATFVIKSLGCTIINFRELLIPRAFG
jgi:hypothetical protein